MNTYCPNCGEPNPYINNIAPTKCKSCKQNFSQVSFTATKPKTVVKKVVQPTRRPIAPVIIEEGDEEYMEVPHIELFKVKLQGSLKVRPEKIENVLGSGKVGYGKRDKENLSKDEFLQKWQKEGQSAKFSRTELND